MELITQVAMPCLDIIVKDVGVVGLIGPMDVEERAHVHFSALMIPIAKFLLIKDLLEYVV